MKKTVFLIIAGLLVGSIAGVTTGKTTASIFRSSPRVIHEGFPKVITIPKINVSTSIEEVGLDSEGRMEIPRDVFNTGWYRFGPRPGETGNAVIDGHWNTQTGAPSVFYNLGKLKPGDLIEIKTDSDKTNVFAVVSVTTYPADQFPLDLIFGPTNNARLNLITCDGWYNPQIEDFTDRVVVTAVLKK